MYIWDIWYPILILKKTSELHWDWRQIPACIRHCAWCVHTGNYQHWCVRVRTLYSNLILVRYWPKKCDSLHHTLQGMNCSRHCQSEIVTNLVKTRGGTITFSALNQWWNSSMVHVWHIMTSAGKLPSFVPKHGPALRADWCTKARTDPREQRGRGFLCLTSI